MIDTRWQEDNYRSLHQWNGEVFAPRVVSLPVVNRLRQEFNTFFNPGHGHRRKAQSKFTPSGPVISVEHFSAGERNAP
jgi:hypothetical protein